MIKNIAEEKPLPIYGKGNNIRDWLYVEDHAHAIDLIFHKGISGETYLLGGNNEYKNLDLVYLLIREVDSMLNRPKGSSVNLIKFVSDRLGHDYRYAIDSSKILKELNWKASTSFEVGIQKTLNYYLKK
jgi:dTDP-glucose 4,6-dehydratase